MKIEVRWLSQQGTRTRDNRDYAGIGTRYGEFLGIVVDGATNGETNGEYARAIIEATVDWFVESADAWDIDLVMHALGRIHETLRKHFPKGSASIILLHIPEAGCLTVLSSGDCVLGTQDRKFDWQTTPHTLTNALVAMPLDVIAKSPTRHLLTQSFRSREFIRPDVLVIENAFGSYLLATDGFWAELAASDQIAFLGGGRFTNIERDDRSVLQLQLSPGEPFRTSVEDHASANLYARMG
ncbi:hypothetical protein [Rhizobium sp.]|uniref:hypothetical protein n=1 Tax=Rhizobium sp. TaxID=391 RepID=UPI0028ACD74B